VVLVEVILLVAFAVPIWAKRVGDVPDKSQAVEVRVIAEQFTWNVIYPGKDGVFGRLKVPKPGENVAGKNPVDPDDPAGKDDIWSLNQLHLPVGRQALIYLSTKDVIHSFSLPVMRVKQDAIPGQVIPIYFTPTMANPPEATLPNCALKKTCWEIACAQLCGLTHAAMRGFLTIHSEADFQKWLADNAPKPPAPPVAPAPAPAPAAPAAAPEPAAAPAGAV
jgi:cytochrome c oxidase subunit 2